MREDLEKLGILFMDTDTALREHPEIFKEFLARPFSVRRQQVCSVEQRGLERRQFIYVPKGVKGEIPLHILPH